jgi:hypothetical protein
MEKVHAFASYLARHRTCFVLQRIAQGVIESAPQKHQASDALLKVEEWIPRVPQILPHPNMAEIYRRRISELQERLFDDEDKGEAVEVLRTLIDEVVLIPEGNELTIALRGDLAAILAFASNKKRPSPLSESELMGDLLSPVSLVAGARNQRSRRPQPGPFVSLIERKIPKLAA